MSNLKYKCDICGKNESMIIEKRETLQVREDEIEVVSCVRTCECGNELFDEALEEDNLSRAYDLYRLKHSIIAISEIREIRERYALSQRTLGKILGWGEVTIHRYETGAVPDASHNKMLLLLKDPSVVKQLLLDSQDVIPKTTFVRAMQRIGEILDRREGEDFFNLIQKRLKYSNVGIDSGFKQLDLVKLANVVLYFAVNISNLWKTKLNKLLFYSDFICFKELTVSITGLRYLKYEFGPVPQDYEAVIASLKMLGFVDIVPTETAHVNGGDIIKALDCYDPDVFKPEELEVLERVRKKFSECTSREISEYSHKETGWVVTPFHEAISYGYASELN